MQLLVSQVIGRVVDRLERAANALDGLEDLVGLVGFVVILARRMPILVTLTPLRFDPASLPHKLARGRAAGIRLTLNIVPFLGSL